MNTPDQPGGGDNPFAGLPFFGDLMRMLGAQGGSSWDAATQLAVSIATGGRSEPNVDPSARIELEQFARIAEMHVEEATGLSLRHGGRDLRVVPVTRGQWAQQAVRDYRPLFEKLSAALNRPPTPDPEDAADPMAAMFGGIMQMMAPLMLGMTTGSMVGHLAEKALGTYHLPLPRPQTAEVQLVAPNIDAFAEEWSIEPRDLRMWVCLSELSHHAVLSLPHVEARLGELLDRYVAGFRPDPSALEHALGGLDLSSLNDLDAMRKLFGDPTVLLGVIRSPEQQALLPAIDALIAAVVGYVDHIIDQLAHRLLGSAGRLTEALRRRRVEAGDADRFVERLLGMELAQATYDRGAAFVGGVVERAGAAGLARLWEQEETLPTPAEIDAPGLWLARIEFVGR